MNVDVAIIGVGPAGIQAGMHASRKKVSVVLLGRTENSAMYGTHIENHFGAAGKADGTELLREGLGKAERFGCSVLQENVISAEPADGTFRLVTESGTEITAKAVVLASGIRRNRLGVPGEKEFLGKGVSYCAACDANFFKGRTVAVVGEESEAAAAAELMTGYASRTYWVAKDPKVSDVMVSKAKAAGAEMVPSAVRTINGTARVESITLEDGSVIDLDGVFIELGGRSSADLAMDLGIMPDPDGLVKADPGCRTEVPGVFACGDITGRPWQVAKAAGQGAVAGTHAADHAKETGNVGE